MARRSNRSIQASENMTRYWRRRKLVESGRGSAKAKAAVKAATKRWKAIRAAS
jgi:hypothetical protein